MGLRRHRVPDRVVIRAHHSLGKRDHIRTDVPRRPYPGGPHIPVQGQAHRTGARRATPIEAPGPGHIAHQLLRPRILHRHRGGTSHVATNTRLQGEAADLHRGPTRRRHLVPVRPRTDPEPGASGLHRPSQSRGDSRHLDDAHARGDGPALGRASAAGTARRLSETNHLMGGASRHRPGRFPLLNSKGEPSAVGKRMLGALRMEQTMQSTSTRLDGRAH